MSLNPQYLDDLPCDGNIFINECSFEDTQWSNNAGGLSIVSIIDKLVTSNTEMKQKHTGHNNYNYSLIIYFLVYGTIWVEFVNGIRPFRVHAK